MKRVGQIYRETLIDKIKEGVSETENVFVVSYSQISGFKLSELRKNLKQVGANMHVTRNTIARIALKDLDQEKLGGRLSGQTAFVWGGADSAEVSKVLMKFTEGCDNANIQGGLLKDRFLEVQDIKALSELPSREVLLAMLLSTIQSPLTRLAGALNAKTRELLSVLKQLSEKKGGK